MKQEILKFGSSLTRRTENFFFLHHSFYSHNFIVIILWLVNQKIHFTQIYFRCRFDQLYLLINFWFVKRKNFTTKFLPPPNSQFGKWLYNCLTVKVEEWKFNFRNFNYIKETLKLLFCIWAVLKILIPPIAVGFFVIPCYTAYTLITVYCSDKSFVLSVVMLQSK